MINGNNTTCNVKSLYGEAARAALFHVMKFLTHGCFQQHWYDGHFELRALRSWLPDELIAILQENLSWLPLALTPYQLLPAQLHTGNAIYLTRTRKL